MSNRNLVVIGTSAGGVKALLYLAKSFPADFPASIVVTIHLSISFRSTLDELLTRAGPLRAQFASDGELLRKGNIYIAPPGHHLLIDNERLSLGRGARENNVRPAIDPMFRSVAACCGHRSIAVLLTGTMSDGASGLQSLQQRGALTIVQDPDDAAFPEMPLQALRRSQPDHVVKLSDLPMLLTRLVGQPASEPAPPLRSLESEIKIAKGEPSTMEKMDGLGKRSVFTCPECNGMLWEIEDADSVRYRCHVGHAYSDAVLRMALNENLRHGLESAHRALQERIALMKQLAEQAAQRGSPLLAASWAQKQSDLEREASVIRESLQRIDEIVESAEAIADKRASDQETSSNLTRGVVDPS